MAAATNTTEGEILIAGDFSPAATGTLPVLRASGVSPGSYNYSSGGIDGLGNSIINIPNIVVDSKGRIVYAKVNPYTLSSTVATSSTFGMVKVNGTTITVNTGVISADTGSIATATSSVLGKLRPDNTTVTVTGGVLTSVVPKATSSTLGSVKPDNITTVVDPATGILGVREAWTTHFGIFRPDGITTTIDVATSTVSLQTATSTKKGIHRGDGTTIRQLNNDGVIGVPTANSTTNGRVRPDNTTIFVDSSGILSTPVVYSTAGTVGVSKADELTMSVIAGGVIKLADATSTQVGLVRPDNVSINISSGVLSRNIATSSVVGQVRSDNTTMNVASGILSVPAATSSTLGVARNDNTTLIGYGGLVSIPASQFDRFGTARTDNTTTIITDGTVSVSTATSSTLGLVRANSYMSVTNSILSINNASPTAFGVVRPDLIGIGVSDGVLSRIGSVTLTPASNSQIGFAKPDNTTMTLIGNALSSAQATSSTVGTVKVDLSSEGRLAINDGVLSVVDAYFTDRPNVLNFAQSYPGSGTTTSAGAEFSFNGFLSGNVVSIIDTANIPIDGFEFSGTTICGAEIVLQLVETSAGFGFTFPATSVNNYGGFKVEGGSILPLTNGQMVVADMVVIRKNNLPFGLIYNQQIF